MSEWMTSAEAAAYLKLKPSTLAKYRQLSSKGCLKGPPFSAAQGRVRYRREDLDAWMEVGLARSTIEAKHVRAIARASGDRWREGRKADWASGVRDPLYERR